MKSSRAQVSILFPYIRRYKWSYAVGILALVGTNYFMLLRPEIMGDAVDALKTENPLGQLRRYCLYFLVVILLENLVRIVWRIHLISASRKIERDLMTDFFGHLLNLDARFYDKTPTGDLMARATNDVAAARMLLGPGIMGVVDVVLVLSFALYRMIRISPTMTWCAMLPIPLGAIALMYLMKNVHQRFEAVQAQFSDISSRVQESMSGIRVIKAHNRQDYEIGEFEKFTGGYIQKFMKLAKYEVGFEPVFQLVAGAGTMIILFVGGNAVMQGTLTLGELVKFFVFLQMLMWPMMAIGWSANIFEQASASLARLGSILDRHPEIEPVPVGSDHTVPYSSGDIEFDNVTFRFTPEGPDVLKGVNLRIPRGSALGVLGALGSGKTALLGLIPRLYDPVEGEIRIGGRSIRDFSPEDLRGHVGFVPQEPFLFSKNISKNIEMGAIAPSRRRKDSLQSLDLAQVAEDMQGFPRGLETVLGERGVRLSGGQKQRMTIARALARDPDILILDDSLSSVDTQTEGRILGNLREYMQGRTNIIVAHRISTVKDADQIIVLEEGRIIEQGNHEQLLELDGFYAKLYRQQQLQEELERI